MKKRLISVTTISYVLILIYGIILFSYLAAFMYSFKDKSFLTGSSLFTSGFKDVDEFMKHATISWILYFVQIIGLFGVVQLKEWGRKCVIVISVLSCLYVTYRMAFVVHGVDGLSVANIFVYAGIIIFFSWPRIKRQFRHGSNLGKKEILIVDDDRGFLKMVKAVLTKRGFSVIAVSSGEECLEVVKESGPDLIILDVLMPKIKGREVCRLLKNDDDTKDIPVMFLTAKDSPEDIQAEKDVGGLAHVTKPVDIQKLISEIDRILNA